MPYFLRKSPRRNLYWVVSRDTGAKHSKDPMPLKKAQAQMRALYVAMGKEQGLKGKGLWDWVKSKFRKPTQVVPLVVSEVAEPREHDTIDYTPPINRRTNSGEHEVLRENEGWRENTEGEIIPTTQEQDDYWRQMEMERRRKVNPYNPPPPPASKYKFPPEPEIYIMKPYPGKHVILKANGEVIHNKTGNLTRERWDAEQKRLHTISVDKRTDWYLKYGQWLKYPAGDPQLREYNGIGYPSSRIPALRSLLKKMNNEHTSDEACKKALIKGWKLIQTHIVDNDALMEDARVALRHIAVANGDELNDEVDLFKEALDILTQEPILTEETGEKKKRLEGGMANPTELSVLQYIRNKYDLRGFSQKGRDLYRWVSYHASHASHEEDIDAAEMANYKGQRSTHEGEWYVMLQTILDRVKAGEHPFRAADSVITNVFPGITPNADWEAGTKRAEERKRQNEELAALMEKQREEQRKTASRAEEMRIKAEERAAEDERRKAEAFDSPKVEEAQPAPRRHPPGWTPDLPEEEAAPPAVSPPKETKEEITARRKAMKAAEKAERERAKKEEEDALEQGRLENEAAARRKVKEEEDAKAAEFDGETRRKIEYVEAKLRYDMNSYEYDKLINTNAHAREVLLNKELVAAEKQVEVINYSRRVKEMEAEGKPKADIDKAKAVFNKALAEITGLAKEKDVAAAAYAKVVAENNKKIEATEANVNPLKRERVRLMVDVIIPEYEGLLSRFDRGWAAAYAAHEAAKEEKEKVEENRTKCFANSLLLMRKMDDRSMSQEDHNINYKKYEALNKLYITLTKKLIDLELEAADQLMKSDVLKMEISKIQLKALRGEKVVGERGKGHYKGAGIWDVIKDAFNPKKVINELTNPESISRRRISEVSAGVRENYPPSSRATIQKYGSWRIIGLQIRRDPVQSAIHTAFNILSMGKWDKARRDENYDRLFHLGLVATLENDCGSKHDILMEKNEVINIGETKPREPDTEMLRTPHPNETLSEFLNKAEAATGKERFFKYDPFKYNCQDFIMALLSANGVNTPAAKKFIKQDVLAIVDKLPSYVAPIARGITDIGAIANVALEGAGGTLKGGAHPPDDAPLEAKRQWLRGKSALSMTMIAPWVIMLREFPNLTRIREDVVPNDIMAALRERYANWPYQGIQPPVRNLQWLRDGMLSLIVRDLWNWNAPEELGMAQESRNIYSAAVRFCNNLTRDIQEEGVADELPPGEWPNDIIRPAALDGDDIVDMEGAGKSAGRATLGNPAGKFLKQLEKAGYEPSAYLEEARRRAKKNHYPYKLLGFASDGTHKLAIPDENGRVVSFGKVGYGDHLIYSHLEAAGRVSAGTAQKKQSVFQKSHSKIKGDWKQNPFSPNNLAMKVLW